MKYRITATWKFDRSIVVVSDHESKEKADKIAERLKEELDNFETTVTEVEDE